MVAGWPVQFLPASTALETEALEKAVPTTIGGVETSVMTADHLVAIALATAAPKISLESSSLSKTTCSIGPLSTRFSSVTVSWKME